MHNASKLCFPAMLSRAIESYLHVRALCSEILYSLAAFLHIHVNEPSCSLMGGRKAERRLGIITHMGGKRTKCSRGSRSLMRSWSSCFDNTVVAL